MYANLARPLSSASSPHVGLVQVHAEDVCVYVVPVGRSGMDLLTIHVVIIIIALKKNTLVGRTNKIHLISR